MLRFMVGLYGTVAAYMIAKMLLARSYESKFKWAGGVLFAPFPVILVAREFGRLHRPVSDWVYAWATTAALGYLVLALIYESKRPRT